MPSRRRVLAASVPLLAFAGCLGPDAADRADLFVTNDLDRAIIVTLTIEPESGGQQLFERTVDLAPAGVDVDTETFSNPVGEDGTYTVTAAVEDGPRESSTFVDEGNAVRSRGLGQAQVRVRSDGVEITAVTS